MSTHNYTQYGLEPLFEVELEDGVAPIQFDVVLKAEDGRIVLRYEQPGVKDNAYIAIRRNSIVEITLIGDQLFFSKDYDAITTKEPLASFYGGLTYDDYDRKLDRYKKVRFQARYNQGGKYGTRHRFNINVDLLQNPGAAAPEWIALSIDPDIKNPPPKDD
ncbi:MAG: hypothetical protein COC10_01455 [Sphingobium sp.]|nr:MAG: hypothetical protein COC10_01455 [Sphingobium sp.]